MGSFNHKPISDSEITKIIKKKLITVQKIPGSAMKTKEDTIIPRFSFKISFYVRFVNCKKLLLVNDPNFISFYIYLQTNIHV